MNENEKCNKFYCRCISFILLHFDSLIYILFLIFSISSAGKFQFSFCCCCSCLDVSFLNSNSIIVNVCALDPFFLENKTETEINHLVVGLVWFGLVGLTAWGIYVFALLARGIIVMSEKINNISFNHSYFK